MSNLQFVERRNRFYLMSILSTPSFRTYAPEYHRSLLSFSVQITVEIHIMLWCLSLSESRKIAVWPRGNTITIREKTIEVGTRKRKYVTASRRTCLVTTLVLTASINEPYYSITLVLHIHAGQITLGHVNRGTCEEKARVTHITCVTYVISTLPRA